MPKQIEAETKVTDQRNFIDTAADQFTRCEVAENVLPTMQHDPASSLSIKEQVLLQEYQMLASFVNTFFTMRATMFGIGVAILGAIIQLSRDTQPAMLFFFDLCLIAIAVTLGSMIGASIRAGYMFVSRMANISECLNATSYWHVWRQYVIKHPQDSGTWAFVVAQRTLYVGVALFLWIGQVPTLTRVLERRGISLPDVPTLVLPVAGSLFLIVKIFGVSNSMDPGRFGPRIRRRWEAAFAVAAEEQVAIGERVGLRPIDPGRPERRDGAAEP